MEFIKLKNLKHSGQGTNAIHIQVMNEFRKSEEQGVAYCKKKGYEVTKTDILLIVKQKGQYGFQMSALYKN